MIGRPGAAIVDGKRIERAVFARRPLLVAVAAALVLAFLYLLTKLHNPKPMTDWDSLWYAGWLWNHGYSPYAADFARQQRAAVGVTDLPPFFYPPHFWMIASPMARFGEAPSRILWSVMNIALLLGGIALWGRVAAIWRQAARLQAALLLFAVCLMTGTGFALTIGQTSFVIWFAIALLAFGIVGGSRWQVSLALTLLLLKPQFGVVVLLALAVVYRDVRVLAGTAAMMAAATLPTLLIAGPFSLLDFVRNVGGYSGYAFNRLDSMTGIGNLLVVYLRIDPPKQLLILAAGIGSAALLLLFPGRPEERDRRFLVVVLGLLAVLVPLHTYDLFFLLALPLILMPAATPAGLAAAAIGLLLCVRPENLGGPSGPTVAVIGTLVLVVAAFAALPLFARAGGVASNLGDRRPA